MNIRVGYSISIHIQNAELSFGYYATMVNGGAYIKNFLSPFTPPGHPADFVICGFFLGISP